LTEQLISIELKGKISKRFSAKKSKHWKTCRRPGNRLSWDTLIYSSPNRKFYWEKQTFFCKQFCYEPAGKNKAVFTAESVDRPTDRMTNWLTNRPTQRGIEFFCKQICDEPAGKKKMWWPRSHWVYQSFLHVNNVFISDLHSIMDHWRWKVPPKNLTSRVRRDHLHCCGPRLRAF